jgi:nucleoside-diphosphate-sugar epimerase
MAVRVFVAGGSGAVGRRLVPQLVARGHQVTATATGPAKLRLLEQLGADGVVMEGGWVKTEEDPLDPGPADAREGAKALGHLEDVVVKAGNCATPHGARASRKSWRE